MRQICFNKAVLGDARFARLLDTTGWGRAEAAGVLVFLWAHTRDRKASRCPTAEDLRAALPFERTRAQRAVRHLLECGYLLAEDDRYVVVDNAAFFSATDKMSEAGRRGGYPAHKTKTVRKPRIVKSKPVAPSSSVWAVYSDCYLNRYGVQPLRNARVNAQISQLVGRVGVEEAQQLAAFFLQHPGRYYGQRQHAVGDMLRDCEQLVVQMRRGLHHTEHAQKAQDDEGRLQAQMHRLGVVG